MLLLFRLKNCCIFVSESYWWTIKTFNSKIHNKTKKEFLLKTQNPTCWDYAFKSDDDSKNRTKPISWNYAVKSDNDPKTNKPISLSMLLKAIMTQKPNLWNQTNHLSVFSGALTTQNFRSWNSWLKLALQNVDFHRLWKTSSLWKSFF